MPIKPVAKLYGKILPEENKKIISTIKKAHPGFFSVGIYFLLALITAIVFKLFYTGVKYGIIPFWWKFRPVDEIEHIDVAGLICGILSIIIVFLITFIVEANHHLQTKSLLESTNNILDRYTALVPQKYLSQRLKAVNSIIKMTKKSQTDPDPNFQNSIYILNYDASYGYLQSFNAHIILKDEKTKPHPTTWKEYHKIHTKYWKKQKNIFERLLTLDPESVHIALLRTEKAGFKNQEDNYKKLINKILTDNKKNKVQPYHENDTDRNNFRLIENMGKEIDTYAMHLPESDSLEENQGTLKNKLIDNFCNFNNKKIGRLKDSGFNKMVYLDYIPFQFFLSIPNDKSKSVNQKCLLIFTNILSLKEHPTDTVSFLSENAELIQLLKDMHDTITHRQRAEDEGKQKLLRLFDCVESEPCFILTEKHEVAASRGIKNTPGKSASYSETYSSDIAAYKDLAELFADNEIVCALPQYDDPKDFDRKNKITDRTFIVIGLFKNRIADRLKKTVNYWFDRNVKETETGIVYSDEVIKIRNSKNALSDGSDGEWVTYRADDDFDYALLAKVKNENSTTIICGGLSGYGTEIMGKYIREELAEIVDEIGIENLKCDSYAIVFRIARLKKEHVEYDNSVVKNVKMVGTVFTDNHS